jgi:hypothetical protein
MIPRTTEIISEIYPFDRQAYESWCEENGHDPEYILDFASNFGTEMHKWCLEGVIPSTPTPLHIACYKQWLLAVKECGIELISVEDKVSLFHEGQLLCTGIRDSVAKVNAPKQKIVGIAQVDLKFYSCWLGINEPYKKPSANKLAKANIQTYNYNVSAGEEGMLRGILHIMPTGYGLYKCSRRPLAGYKEFIAIAQAKVNELTF